MGKPINNVYENAFQYSGWKKRNGRNRKDRKKMEGNKKQSDN